MPRKEQGWITFQTSEEERQLLEEICHNSQRTKTEVLRELVRGLRQQASESRSPSNPSPSSAQHSQLIDLRPPEPPSPKKPLKISSRNVLQGTITRLIPGAVNTEVTLKIVHEVELTSIITRASAEELGLVEGAEAYAVIKSSDVVIATE